MGLIIDGRDVELAMPIFDWRSTGLEFKAGEGHNKARKKTIDLLVLHWTGGEGDAKQMFNVLRRRELGVEFFIDDEGLIWQFADPAFVDTADAGKYNARSIGVEIQNYGHRRDPKDIPRKGTDRRMYQTTLHNRKCTFARFRPVQIAAAICLVDSVCNAVPTIKKQIPRDATGYFVARTMRKNELDTYAGVVGHFHLTAKKTDPGTDIFEALDACGY